MSHIPDTITVDGVAYIRGDLAPQPGDLHIVILQRGRVVVGNLTIDGDYGTLTNAACVRRWGTTAGLGQLANEGPTKDTVLDKQPATRFHVLTSVEIIACNAEAWAQ
jgi:hypothetical protein